MKTLDSATEPSVRSAARISGAGTTAGSGGAIGGGATGAIAARAAATNTPSRSRGSTTARAMSSS
ncbi:hypothetical protein D3C83_248690 [compost metagenome]